MKTKMVPAKELTTKTLRAKDYVEPKGSKKTPKKVEHKGECPWCKKPGYEKGKSCPSCTFTEGKEHWVRYISSNHVTDEHFDGCQYAVAKITTSFVEEVAKRKKLFDAWRKKDKDLLYVEFWDNTPDFYDSFIFDADADLIDSAKHVIDEGSMPTDKAETARVECCHLVLSDRGFYWTCYPKHVDGVTVETDLIEWKEVGL